MTSKFQLFTFRTFPQSLLETYSLEAVFKFGKIKEGLLEFEALVDSSNTSSVIGFALSRVSRIETVAINQFNRGMVDKTGPNEILLEDILKPSIAKAKTVMPPTFCNYTCYKLAQKYQVSFYHVSKADMEEFLKLLTMK